MNTTDLQSYLKLQGVDEPTLLKLENMGISIGQKKLLVFLIEQIKKISAVSQDSNSTETYISPGPSNLSHILYDESCSSISNDILSQNILNSTNTEDIIFFESAVSSPRSESPVAGPSGSQIISMEDNSSGILDAINNCTTAAANAPQSDEKFLDIQKILKKNYRGKQIIESLQKNKYLTHAERSELTRLVVADLVQRHGYYPTADIKTLYAKSIIKTFPCLAIIRNDEIEEYSHFFDEISNTGFLQYRLKTVRRLLPPEEKRYKKRRLTVNINEDEKEENKENCANNNDMPCIYNYCCITVL